MSSPAPRRTAVRTPKQRAGDAALPPDHLAHVRLGHPQLEHGRAVALGTRDRHLVGVVDETLGQIGDELLQS